MTAQDGSSRSTPRQRIATACQRLGAADVAGRCAGLLRGGDAPPDFIVVLGGPAAIRLLEDGVPDSRAYWLRVWAARGLLWAGPDRHEDAIREALRDDSWRVREMACRVVARHGLGDLLDDVAALEADRVARVRSAARRAVTRVVEVDA